MDKDEIRAARKKLGLTQTEFGKKLGGSKLRTVQAWEKGERNMPPVTQIVVKQLLKEKEEDEKRAQSEYAHQEAVQLKVEDPKEQLPNKTGNVYEELPNGRFRIYTKKVPVKAFASYLSEFRNAHFYEDLEDVSWVVDKFGRGRYATFESEGDSMNGGGLYDTPGGADMLCRELLRDRWMQGFRESIYGWVIVHRETVVHKDIKSFDQKTGVIVCSSRSGLPQHPDFPINADDILEVWKVIKRSF